LLDGGDGAATTLKPSLRSLEPYPIPFELAAALEVIRDRAGVVTFKNVPQGRFAFDLRGLPANAYIADIRPGPTFYEEGFSVPGEAGGVFDILVRTDGAAVRGFVRDIEGKPIPGATVILVPDPPRRSNVDLYKKVQTNTDGGFSFSGAAPGEYKVFGWKEVPPNAWLNAEFIERYEGAGKAVSAVAGTTIQTDVGVIAEAAR
jgi:hypothetical protein